jgi:hypothetical protein
MKTALRIISNDLDNGNITDQKARTLLFGLLAVSNSVFIVCENDDYGRDLYLCTKNTMKDAKEVKGRDNTRNIYEHDVFENDY